MLITNSQGQEVPFSYNNCLFVRPEDFDSDFRDPRNGEPIAPWGIRVNVGGYVNLITQTGHAARIFLNPGQIEPVRVKQIMSDGTDASEIYVIW